MISPEPLSLKCSFVVLNQSMNKIGSLQIGHSHTKEGDFKIENEVIIDEKVEVSFSHRHLFYAVYWIHEGYGAHIIDFVEYEIKPDRIFFIQPEQVHFIKGEVNMKYSALQFNENFMLSFLNDEQKELPVFKDLNEDEKIRISRLFMQIQTESICNLPNSIPIIQSEINILLLELERMNLATTNYCNVPNLIRQYKDMINRNFVIERQVQYYAAQLGITPNYLNILVKKHLGKSALGLINERVILEVKRLLLYPHYTISEVAYRLGFNELSYFSRFFKRNTGITPHAFRELMNKMYHK